MLRDLSRHFTCFLCLTLCTTWCPRTYDPFAFTSHRFWLAVGKLMYFGVHVHRCSSVCVYTGKYVWLCVLWWPEDNIRYHHQEFHPFFWGRISHCLKLTNYGRMDFQWTIGILLSLLTQCWNYKGMSSMMLSDWVFTPSPKTNFQWEEDLQKAKFGKEHEY